MKKFKFYFNNNYMNSNDEIQPDEYSIEVNKSGPQLIDPKKSHFLFDKYNNMTKSPRREFMISNTSKSSGNLKSQSFQIPVFTLNEKKVDPLMEKIEQKITENIKNREGFESLLQDPDINKLISK